MFGLQVHAPGHLVLEVGIVLLEQFDGLGVADPGKIRVGHQLQALQQALVKELVEEGQFVGAVLQQEADDVFGHGFGGVHVGV